MADATKKEDEVVVSQDAVQLDDLERPAPTEEDWKTLREVPGTIPWAAFLVIVIEFCERFTYYGISGPFQNYVQFPDPGEYPAEQPGAMGRGQQTATALNTFFQFWCYITPIIGGVIADQYLGKINAIILYGCMYFVGLLILTLTAIPSAISSGSAFPGFVVAIIVIGMGTGGIKANVSPLVAEQYQDKTPYVMTTKKGERVIVSPQATYQRIFNMFYWATNVGGISAIATTEMEKNIGFWAAFLLPTCMFIPGILIVVLGRKRYVQSPPRGSVVLEAGKVIWYHTKINGFFPNLDKMDACKPSNLAISHPEIASKATWDDVFVDEFKRTLRACVVFCWYPIYWLCYLQISNNLLSQAATMWTGNVPNDIMICMIPIFDRVIYPTLRRFGFHMRPITRISLGFFFGSVAMAYTAGIQSKIYSSPPYYDHPSDAGGKNYISAAYQIPSYCFVALSEIFTLITGMEYAYKKAPESMKAIVMSLFLFTNCVAALLGFALVSVAVDPKLTWMYTGIAGAAFCCSILVWVFHRKQNDTDVQEDSIARTAEQAQQYNAAAPKHSTKHEQVEYELGDQEKGPSST